MFFIVFVKLHVCKAVAHSLTDKNEMMMFVISVLGEV